MNNDLISRSALLEQECFMDDDNGFHCSVVLSTDVRRAPAVDAGPAWISVKDRLPDEDDLMNNGEFIVMIKGAVNATTLLFDGGEWTDEEGTPYPVTHWMPLPEPPKEV